MENETGTIPVGEGSITLPQPIFEEIQKRLTGELIEKTFRTLAEMPYREKKDWSVICTTALSGGILKGNKEKPINPRGAAIGAFIGCIGLYLEDIFNKDKNKLDKEMAGVVKKIREAFEGRSIEFTYGEGKIVLSLIKKVPNFEGNEKSGKEG